MLKLYTCYCCSFPFKADDGMLPCECPACGASPDNFLGEPYNEQEIRRIHVDPPTGNADRDPMDLKWHMPKHFPARTRNGRLRRFVFEYDEPKILRDFYTDVFGWDIINTETSNPERPLMYCATGPGNANWEPRVVSFCYGFLKARDSEDTGLHPMYVIEVDSIDKTVELVEQYGGKLRKPAYTVDGQLYAVVEDSEGNGLYLWQTPSTVTWEEPESQTL